MFLSLVNNYFIFLVNSRHVCNSCSIDIIRKISLIDHGEGLL